MLTTCLMLAQATTTQGSGTPPSGLQIFLTQFFPFLLIIGVFWFLMSRGRSKERARYEQMLNSLKKGDRVQTIGGVLGTVVDVRDHEVVVKVDESTNTKVRFVKSAIREVVQESATPTAQPPAAK